MPAKQWVVTVVAEGSCNPFDIVSDFLESLRVQGDYDIISSVITPASDIGPSDKSAAIEYDNDGYNSAYPDIPTFAETLERLDGHHHTVYAGISVSRDVR